LGLLVTVGAHLQLLWNNNNYFLIIFKQRDPFIS
jgi:hypothetical protein